MFVDASALCAVLLLELDAERILRKLESSPRKVTSPLALWETAVAVSRVLKLDTERASSQVDAFLKEMVIEVMAVPPETAAVALQAFDRYGKGRHQAKLNFGDCFAYACAKTLGIPLLFKGDDFAQTDIAAA